MTSSADGTDAAPPAPRARYADPERRRGEIIDAAIVVFGQHGYDGASLRAIAAEAGTTHQTVVNLFESKVSLFQAVLSRRYARDAKARASQAPEGTLADIAILMTRRNRENRTVMLLDSTLRAEALRDGHPAHDYFAALTSDFTAKVRGALEAERDAGRVRADVNLDATARQYTALIEGLQTQWLYEPSIDTEAVVRSFFENLGPLGER